MSIPDGSSGAADGGKTWTVVFPDGTSVNPGYRVTRDPSYPGIADDYRRTFRVLASLKPDIWLTPHNGDEFDAKRTRASREGVRAWVDPSGYRKWLAGKKEQFDSAVAKEQAAGAPR
jgi:metallo-beta-lactamase class B